MDWFKGNLRREERKPGECEGGCAEEGEEEGGCGKQGRSRRGGARNARAFVSLQRAKLKGAEVGCEGPQMHLPQSRCTV